MSKMRVYEYAKQNNMTSKEVLEKLKDLNVDISNHMSMISSDIKNKLDQEMNKTTTSDKPKKTESKKKQSNKRANKGSTKKGGSQTKQKKITYSGTLTVSQLADKLKIDTSEIIKNIMFLGIMST